LIQLTEVGIVKHAPSVAVDLGGIAKGYALDRAGDVLRAAGMPAKAGDRLVQDEHRAVAISAAVFALMHLQYDWSIMLLIFPMGVALGYARSRSASIWVPVLLHVLNNTVSIFMP
jgi:hypothetical protein